MERKMKLTLGGVSLILFAGSWFSYELISNHIYLPGSKSIGDNHSVVTNEIAVFPQLRDDPEVNKRWNEDIKDIRTEKADMEKRGWKR